MDGYKRTGRRLWREGAGARWGGIERHRQQGVPDKGLSLLPALLLPALPVYSNRAEAAVELQ